MATPTSLIVDDIIFPSKRRLHTPRSPCRFLHGSLRLKKGDPLLGPRHNSYFRGNGMARGNTHDPTTVIIRRGQNRKLPRLPLVKATVLLSQCEG